MKWGNKKKKGFTVQKKNQSIFNFFKKKKKYNSPNTPKLTYKKRTSLADFFSFLSKPNYTHWIACLIAGVLSGLCLPRNIDGIANIFQSIFIWFTIAPLFIVIWTSKSYIQTIGKSLFAGLCFNLIGFNFLLGIHPLDWLGVPEHLSLIASIAGLLIASFQQALYWSLFGLILKFIQKTIGFNNWTAIYSGIIWIVLIERIANTVNFHGNPMTSLYLTQHNTLYLIQGADILGPSLYSFMIIATNATIACWAIQLLDIKVHSTKESAPGQTKFIECLSMSAQLLVFFTMSFCYSFWQLNIAQQSNYNVKEIKTLLLQSNLSIADTRLSEDRKNIPREYLNQFKAVNNIGNPTLAVIPEGAIRQSKADNLSKYLSKVNPLTAWIIGSYHSQTSKEGAKESYNSAIAYDSKNYWDAKTCSLIKQKPVSERKDLYLKQVLVPFGEFIPLKDTFSKILSKFNLEYLADNEFKVSSQAKAFDLTLGKVAPLICFEIFFPEIVHSQVRAGAEGLIVIGDIAWFHKNKQQISAQMIAASQFRAIESRKEIAISLNKGPLVFIDKYGRLKSISTNSNYLYGDLNLNQNKTILSKYYK